MNAPTVSISVANRFHQLRRIYLIARLATIVVATVAAAIAVWMTLSWFDYLWEWPTSVRRPLAVGAAVLVGSAGLWRLFLSYRDTRQRRFAASVEGSFADFGQRVRTVLDTVDGRVSGPEPMLAALGHQTLGRWETLNPSQMVPKAGLALGAAAALIAALLALGLFLGGGDMRVAMKRALGADLPYTHLRADPGNARILEGSPVRLSLQLTGRTDREVALRYRILDPELSPEETDDSWIESELSADDESTRTAATFGSDVGAAEDPIEYQFVTSVGNTPTYRIDVRPLIEVQRIEAVVQPPAYTGLEQRRFGKANLTVLENSVVRVTIETTHALAEAKLEVGPKASRLSPVDLGPGDRADQWTFELPSEASIHWRFSGGGEDTTPMVPLKGRLHVRRDAVPTVRWNDPPDEIRVHTLTELPFSVQASDDYGLSEAGIVFQLGGDDEYVLDDWVRDDDGKLTTRISLGEILPLESFQLTERDYVSYFAYAVDNRGDRPQRFESDIRYVDIRPLRQFFGEIELDPSDNDTARILNQLSEIIRRQRFLINRTRRMAKSGSSDVARQLGMIDRLVEGQSELAGLTRFLADFFAQQGNDDVEALNQAEAAMLQAADSLGAGSFDLALVQEEDALRALAEARRNLEIFLIKNPTPAQRDALRRLARQLRQKLRREQDQTDREVADSLRRIAAGQRSLTDSAAAVAMASSASGSSAGRAGAQGGEQGDSGQAEQAAGEPQSPAPDDNADGDSDDRSETESGTESGDDESGEDEADDEESGGVEQIYAEQVDLMERLREIEEQLSERLGRSSLLTERMEAASEAMNDLASSARDGEMSEFQRQSEDTADLLMEMSLQVEALSTSQPVSRVSALRDLTRGLANREQQLSRQLRTGSSSADQRSDQRSGQPNGSAADRARQLSRRAATIEDILKAPADTGDVETSEVNEFLQRFAEDTEFLELLEQSREAGNTIAAASAEDERPTGADASDDSQRGEAMSQRSVDYADAARRLDELYRQLVTPRLARLRDLEQRAAQLARAFSQGQGRSDSEQRRPPSTPQQEAGMRQLARELEQEGLGELSEILDPAEWTDEEVREMRAQGGDGDGRGMDNDKGRPGARVSRLAYVATELQRRIQEIILLDVSSDRDAPVPVQYRRAVDRYFRALAGQAEAMSPRTSAAADSGDAL